MYSINSPNDLMDLATNVLNIMSVNVMDIVALSYENLSQVADAANNKSADKPVHAV